MKRSRTDLENLSKRNGARQSPNLALLHSLQANDRNIISGSKQNPLQHSRPSSDHLVSGRFLNKPHRSSHISKSTPRLSKPHSLKNAASKRKSDLKNSAAVSQCGNMFMEYTISQDANNGEKSARFVALEGSSKVSRWREDIQRGREQRLGRRIPENTDSSGYEDGLEPQGKSSPMPTGQSAPPTHTPPSTRIAPDPDNELSPSFDSYRAEIPQPRMRRAETIPAQPSKSSRREKAEPNTAKARTELPKHMHDSGYSTPSAPTTSDWETQPPASSRKTTTSTYRYGDNGDCYNTITVEPPSSSERDSRDGYEHRERSSSPLRDRRRSRSSYRSRTNLQQQAMPTPIVRPPQHSQPAPVQKKKGAMFTLGGSSDEDGDSLLESHMQMSHQLKHIRSSLSDGLTRAKRSHKKAVPVRTTPIPTNSRSDDAEVMLNCLRYDADRELERALISTVIPKHAGEPLRREPQLVRPTMKRNDSYNRDISYGRKIGPEDIHQAPRSRERIHDAEQFAYAYPSVNVPRPPMPTRGYTTVN